MNKEKPWENEPDHLEFEYRGFPSIIHRNSTLCGYVGLKPGHQYHGKSYDDVAVEVHGGLTYADKCHGPICHKAKDGEPDDIWWLGFDCGHGGDYIPRLADSGFLSHDRAQYRTIEYVTKEIKQLVDQLHE